MKKLFLLISFFLITATNISCSAKDPFQEKQNTYVYICTGKYAKVYHSTNECRGLRNCKGDIIKVTLYDATHKYGRRACKECE
jgi:hypothetical protein